MCWRWIGNKGKEDEYESEVPTKDEYIGTPNYSITKNMLLKVGMKEKDTLVMEDVLEELGLIKSEIMPQKSDKTKKTKYVKFVVGSVVW